jgi:23S rRNA pseudouridine1911/1915/1917 synthase
MIGSENNRPLELKTTDRSDLRESFTVASSELGQRLDHVLAHKYPEQSRSALNKMIGAAHVLVDAQQVKAGYRLRVNEIISVCFPPAESHKLIPEQVAFTLLYEDDHLLVLNKPPGLVVHPAGGHHSGTLVHGLLYRCQNLPGTATGRPGIVHRLDKDTSGVMLVAKSEYALRTLMADFKDRKIQKTYHALLVRCPREREGRIVAPIGRHPVDRKKMAIRLTQGKDAATNWHILEHFVNGWCLAEIGIETGRTHQIRVHMASLKVPVAGDRLYGGAVGCHTVYRPTRQMLHASTLCFNHPVTGKYLKCTAPLFEDMQTILDMLRQVAA